ncbi:signal transduction histidine kinase [Nocardiopsis mwathae]|uniref:Oxygen sensor histidine kinase NreB n=1 Tax=Nocardiopsis mwathae TaxID=1472723 RepID=A0A7X0D4D0_9ACTN|nr:sensor histidine kinase [Nocardiopsis mwathae]MBB6170631.1 signal transduction histidine kinase [Nocardiopsis mwathae]
MKRDAKDTSSRRSAVSLLVDIAAAAAVVLVFWIPSMLAPGGDRWLGAGLAVLVSGAMVLRWKAPSAAVSVALVSTAVGWFVSATTDPMVSVAWCLYPLALQRKFPTRGAGSVVVGVLVLATLVLGVSGSTQDLMQRVVFGFGAIGVAWLLGHVEGERLSAVRRAERQQAEFEHVQREAAMAREVHDIVGHALSTISAQAGIARAVSSSDKEEMLEALEDIENRSRDALGQVQSLVRAMRRRDHSWVGANGGRSPAAALRETVTAATVSGLTVDAHIDLPECGRDVTFVATRVVQEALSNIIRHAAAERCELMVAPVEGKLVVRVNDDGTGLLAREGAGSGISGMRERVESVGGRLTVANRLGGGTSVLAELPLVVEN